MTNLIYKKKFNLEIYFLEFIFILSFFPFLRLSMWGGGVENIFTGDLISLIKLSIRLIGIFVVSIYLIKYSKFFHRFLIGPNLFMSIFLFLALMSILYSANRFYSLFRLAEHITFFVLSIVLIHQYSKHFENNADATLNRITTLIALSLGCILMVVWLFLLSGSDAVWRRLIGDSFGLGGEVIHVHTLAILSVIFIFILINKLFSSFYNKKFILILFIGAAISTLALTLSRTGYVMLIISFLILIFNIKNLRVFFVPIFFTVLLTIVLFNLSIFVNFIEIFMRQQNLQELFQLSSRTIFWQEMIIDTAAESPFLGYGYQMMSYDGTTKVFESLGFIARGNAHNTFVQTFSGLGVIGLSVLFLNILSSIITYTNFKKIYSELYSSNQIFMIMGLISLTLVASLTQYGIVGMTTPVVPVYLLCISYLSYFSSKDRIHI